MVIRVADENYNLNTLKFKKVVMDAIAQKNTALLLSVEKQLFKSKAKKAIEIKELIYEALEEAGVDEDGEASFQSLYAYLINDMAQYDGNIDHLTWYSALVLNMFVHVATFTPHEGHGKVQAREFAGHKSQLQYYRSQGNHPQASFFRILTKQEREDKQGIRNSRLPMNEAFLKLVEVEQPNICRDLKEMDAKTGYPKDIKKGSKKLGYVMTQIAHAGARKNNILALIQGMEQALASEPEQSAQQLQQKLTGILKPTKSIKKRKPDDCIKRINGYLKAFKKISLDTSTDSALSTHLLTYRTERVNLIKQRINDKKLKHIEVDTSSKHMTSLMLRLYPACKVEDDTYKEGVTNVLLSFFGALLNHHAQKRKMRLHTERRQSFGFLRPTLTDAGCLTLRLSLGLEPEVFNEVILESLDAFEILLEEFKFDKKEDPSVSKVFELSKEIPEVEEGENKPRTPDAHIRSVTRKDDKILLTYRQAQAYINQAALTQAPDYLSQAMKNYLDGYVYKQETLTLKASPALVNDHVQTIASPVVDLLRNTLNYALQCVEKLEPINADEPHPHFLNTYQHSLGKLFNKAQAASDLLKKINQIDATEFYQQALALSEDMLEYLISLNGLQLIRAKSKGEGVAPDPVAVLHEMELNYTKKALGIPSAHLNLYFTDSGQQAITTSLLSLLTITHGPTPYDVNADASIYLFRDSYYEVPEFLKDCKKDGLNVRTKSLQQARIVFTDVTQLEHFDCKKCNNMQALVVDMTHHPMLSKAEIKAKIEAAYAQTGLVFLVESTLKHGELGLDKYQAGKITILSDPAKKKLTREHLDPIKAVSEEAMHPLAASYLSMVNEICREKLAPEPKSKKESAAHALKQHSVFSSSTQTAAIEQTVVVSPS